MRRAASSSRSSRKVRVADRPRFPPAQLVAITKKRKPLDVEPAQFIVGSKSGDDDGADLDDDTQVCSCHNVTKGDIGHCIKAKGATTLADIKKQTKAMAGCGGCTPLITGIFKAEMSKAGLKVSTNLCSHFEMSRQDIFNVVKCVAPPFPRICPSLPA